MATNLWKAIRVPFDAIRYGYRELRKALFTAPRPSGTYLVAAASVDEVEAALGRESYAPNWEFSYYERGEVLNLARVEYEAHAVEGITYRWWQTHVRGWDHPDGVALNAHWELEPTENANPHIDGVGFGHDRGMTNLQAVLDRSDLAYAETEIQVD